MNKRNSDRLLTAEEVAERLRISEVTVHKWARQGKIKSIKLSTGRKLRRFYESDVDKFLRDIKEKA